MGQKHRNKTKERARTKKQKKEKAKAKNKTGKGTKQDFRRKIITIQRDSRKHLLPDELTDQIRNEFSRATIKDYESRHRSPRRMAKDRKKSMFMAQLDMLEQDDGVYDPNNKDIANAMSTAYRIFSANDLQNYPGLNDFARMIFYGLKYMGNQDDENSSEYKKTKRFFIKFTNNVLNKNIDERISDEDLVADEILNNLY